MRILGASSTEREKLKRWIGALPPKHIRGLSIEVCTVNRFLTIYPEPGFAGNKVVAVYDRAIKRVYLIRPFTRATLIHEIGHHVFYSFLQKRHFCHFDSIQGSRHWSAKPVWDWFVLGEKWAIGYCLAVLGYDSASGYPPVTSYTVSSVLTVLDSARIPLT